VSDSSQSIRKGKQMRKIGVIGTVAVLVVGAAAFVAQAGTGQRRAATVIHVIEHATTDLVVDTGPTGDSSGDLLTFANDIFDEANAEKVGRDQGDCIRINTIEGSWECRWITFLKGGAITVEGPFYDTHDSVMVITGGRGKYKDAQGSMELKVLADGTGYDFIFHVLS
jgi:allene oxide cyclase